VTGYVRPQSIPEALAARAAHPDWTVIAGGTDLMVEAPLRRAPVGLIDLWGLDDLRGITRDAGGLRIRAATPWLDVVDSALVAEVAPILAAAAREIGALQIQARGTIGGNLGTSSPVGDSLPALLALGADLELRSVRGTRTVPYRDFCTGYRTTVLAADELITAVHVPAQHPDARQLWRKVGTRRAQSISKVMAAAVLRVEAGKIAEVRIGLGAVAERPIRATAAEDVLIGAAPGPEAADAAAAALAGQLRPITDVRSTAPYRLEVAQNLVRRFVLSMALVVGLGGCGSGCGQPVPMSETCEPGAPRGVVEEVTIGRYVDGTFTAYLEGDLAYTVIGGQGSAMLVLNHRLVGDDLPGCIQQVTRITEGENLWASEELPLVTHQVLPDTWITGDALLPTDIDSGTRATLEAEVGGVTASVDVWIDYMPTPDAAGTGLPDALSAE
jgi:CO/xanthine dehydrogenase FAD-binding subunit